MGDWRILHAYADHGIEAEVLGCYGEVVRVGLDPRDTNASQPLRADATQPPLREGAFDLGVFHPPCTKWSDMPDADKDGDAPNHIPDARREARRLCDHYVIENKPRAPLRDATHLTGKQFGLPIQYERAFEASFPIPEPPSYWTPDTETSGFFYSEKSRAWWAAVKGVHADRYTKEALGKNCLPAPMVHHIVRAWLTATDADDGPADYTDYSDHKTAQRRRTENTALGDYAPDP